MPSLAENGTVILLKKIVKYRQFIFLYYLPWEKGMILFFLNKLKFFLPKNALCQVWLKLAQCTVLEKNFKFRKYIFNILLLSSSWEKGVAHILIKLKSLSTKDALYQFGWN